MRRIQFIELHEQPWFPVFLRDEVTDALQCGMNLLKAYAPIAPMLRGTLNSMGERSIVDLCSGGGGPWLHLSRALSNGSGEFQMRLTDKYPNLGGFETMRVASANQVTFCREPVDPLSVPREMRGFRTIFSSFHHFSPEPAAAILQDAVNARQGIGIFEITRRAPSAIALMFPWALLAFVYTPLIRPFRWSRLIWTYAIPLIPFVLLFDGVVSCLRTYRPQEMREMADRLAPAEYEWQAGECRSRAGGMPITYLIGCPRIPPAA